MSALFHETLTEKCAVVNKLFALQIDLNSFFLVNYFEDSVNLSEQL
jgi:hypothetical protein